MEIVALDFGTWLLGDLAVPGISFASSGPIPVKKLLNSFAIRFLYLL